MVRLMVTGHQLLDCHKSQCCNLICSTAHTLTALASLLGNIAVTQLGHGAARLPAQQAETSTAGHLPSSSDSTMNSSSSLSRPKASSCWLSFSNASRRAAATCSQSEHWCSRLAQSNEHCAHPLHNSDVNC
jgi:hypothetical protein